MLTALVDGDLLTMIIDGAMVVAMVGIWILWLRGSRRQDAIERKLEAASAQLEEASAQLNVLMPMIRDLADPRPTPTRFPTKIETGAAQEKSPPKPEPEVKKSDLGSQLSRLLCLHREGAKPESIARQLDIPLAQVKLLLQVHGGGSR